LIYRAAVDNFYLVVICLLREVGKNNVTTIEKYVKLILPLNVVQKNSHMVY
jgi:hypothetical protein